MNWSLWLGGIDITGKTSRVEASLAAENLCGQITVELADRDVLDGVVVPRVPREPVIAYRHSPSHPTMLYYLEEIQEPESPDARTAVIRGRSAGAARLALPWAQQVSKQWTAATTIDAIVQYLAEMCGCTVSTQNDFDVCQYCYAVSGLQPSEVVRDLATRSGQVIWPQVDGSIVIAPRLYTYGTPDVVLSSDEIIVESLDRQVPDFGNRILVSGDAAVAGLSVQVVPLADEDACVVADGQSTVRLIAIVTGADGEPVAIGTTVEWSASSGLMSAATSQTAHVVRQAEVHQADSYTKMTLDLPAVSVIGAYRRTDVRKSRNYFTERGGSVDGRVITFSAPLDYYDQTLLVDYIVAGAPIEWTAGHVPGDVTVLASVAGAQGFATLHQSNPTACATQISMEASPSSPCLGDEVAILLKTTMFGGAGVGAATFGLQGCGSLSSTRKSLSPRQITETLRTSIWGGAVEVRLTAVPAAGTTPSVVLTATPGADLYESHNGQTVILTDDTILPGTEVTVTYVAGGTALIAWLPSALPSGYESISETLLVTHSGEAPDTVAQVTLTRTPVAAPSCVPLMEIGNFYASHENKVVTLLEDSGVILPVGTQVQCSYQSVWQTQPGCSAIVTVRVDDGSEDGGRGQISLTARDCRTVNPSGPGSTYDPEDPDQIPDETTDPAEEDEHDPTSWLEPEEEEVTPTGCGPESINKRTPVITPQNFHQVFGVPSVTNCPGVCTCDEICTTLRASGRLGTEGGMTWSQCYEACNKTRDAVCKPCNLTGPAVLAPGEIGTWTDDKGNNGMFKSINGPTLVERTPSGGYKAKMPSGGSGPFTVQVCYGEDARTCCEATVDFPPCTISGPSSLAQGEEGLFVPSNGMEGASATVSGMVLVRSSAEGFVAKLADNACEGSITIAYGGVVCGTVSVADTYAAETGVVVGEAHLAPGESALFAHNVDGATYTGSLIQLSAGKTTDPETGFVTYTAILMMPDGVDLGETYVASWTGRCGVSASMSVAAIDLYHCTLPNQGLGHKLPGDVLGNNGVPGENPCQVVTSTGASSRYKYDDLYPGADWYIQYGTAVGLVVYNYSSGNNYSVSAYQTERISD